MYTVSREYHFSAAHRLEGHPKCGRLHGHNYKVVVTLTSTNLINGMVMDFSEMDRIIKPLIDGKLDHRYIVSDENMDANCIYFGAAMVAKNNDWVLLGKERSTAESIAEMIFEHVRLGLPADEGLDVSCVTVWETPKSVAVYERP